jgi:succinylarginine dihydrolase
VTAREFEFGSLVGPTHNYAGLSPGNLASERHGGSTSRPRAAALQSLERMAVLHSLGVPQVVLPPQPRPLLGVLRAQGFDGSDRDVIEHAHRSAAEQLATVYSASSMWAANAATVSPSADTGDHRVHVTPANLGREPHRALEAPFTAAVLRAALPDPEHFVHHEPLDEDGDEGAANHTRLCRAYGEPGIELFVFGQPESGNDARMSRHRARQDERASRRIAELHRLPADRALFVQQSPDAIDAGVFHNDVIATGDRDLLFYHEDAFASEDQTIDALRERFGSECGGSLRTLLVPRDRVSLADAVSTYLFNCQLIATPQGGTAWVGPRECQEHEATARLLRELHAEGVFESLHYLDLRESMRNGGGPACLRLRVVLTPEEAAAIPPPLRYHEGLHGDLARIVERHYRDRLEPADLADPALLDEAGAALDAVTSLLGIPSVYDFSGNPILH